VISLTNRLPPSPSALHHQCCPAKVYNMIRKIVKYITQRRSRTISVWHPWNNRNDRGEGLLLLMSTGYFFEWLWFVLPFPPSVTFSSAAVNGTFAATARVHACVRICVQTHGEETRANAQRRNARAHTHTTRVSARASLSSRPLGGAHLRTDWDSSASVTLRCVFSFKCVIGVYARARARFWLPAAPKSPVVVIATNSHYLISACHYALILCAGNYSDRDTNRAHLYGAQYNSYRQLLLEMNFRFVIRNVLFLFLNC